jgi:HD-like signal output (HDOD) protein
MIVTGVVLAIMLAGLGAWMVLRSRNSSGAGLTGEWPNKAAHDLRVTTADASAAERANNLVTERLWKLAFAAPSAAPTLEPAHARVGDAVCAILQAETLDAKYFPRRPSLMPQLMRAVDDPSAATVKLSRMIAHDPVLAADVLRLANSAMFRTSPVPIETIQRAIVMLGADALRGVVATAMLQPVFRATRSNFPRFPRMLWDRTERAVRAAELFALKIHPQDRFEAQLLILMSALGPLVVYGAVLDAYSAWPALAPSPALCAELTAALGPQVAIHIARQWETSPRLVAAIERSPDEVLTGTLQVGELLGTLSLLESQQVMASDEALATAVDAGLSRSIITPIWQRLTTSQ